MPGGNGPDLGRTATQVPDLGPIVATGAPLSHITISVADLPGASIQLTVDVQADTASVTASKGWCSTAAAIR